MRVLQVKFLLLAVLPLMSCANLQVGGLVVRQATPNMVVFEPLIWDDLERPLRLQTSRGVVLSQSTAPAPRVLFSLPMSEQAYATRSQCLEVRTASGRLVPLVGVSTPGFQLPVWQDRLANQFGRQQLMQERFAVNQRINNASQRLREAENWANFNSPHFANGTCPLPPLRAKPPDACRPDERTAFVGRVCGEKLQCARSVEDLRKPLPQDWQKLATLVGALGCRAAAVQGGRHSSDELENVIAAFLELGATSFLVDLLRSSGMSERSAHTYSREVVLAARLDLCMAQQERICTRQYEDWFYAPARIQSTCINHRQTLNTLPSQVQADQQRLAQIDREIEQLSARASRASGPAIMGCSS